MAKNVTGNPWIFDAAAQSEGYAPSEAGDTVNNKGPIFVKEIKVHTGDADADLEILDESGGRRLLFLDGLVAGATISVPFGDGVWWKGVYINTIPTNGEVNLYHGRP